MPQPHRRGSLYEKDEYEGRKAQRLRDRLVVRGPAPSSSAQPQPASPSRSRTQHHHHFLIPHRVSTAPTYESQYPDQLPSPRRNNTYESYENTAPPESSHPHLAQIAQSIRYVLPHSTASSQPRDSGWSSFAREQMWQLGGLMHDGTVQDLKLRTRNPDFWARARILLADLRRRAGQPIPLSVIHSACEADYNKYLLRLMHDEYMDSVGNEESATAIDFAK